MSKSAGKVCAICGDEAGAGGQRFLVAENRWEDRLTILEWSESMVLREGIQSVCCVDHVEELVIHWMTTGSLDYPFARTTLGARTHCGTRGSATRVDLSGVQPIGELAVHRESMERVLAENPESVRVILDALLDALRRNAVQSPNRVSPRVKPPNRELCGAHRDG